MVQIPPAGHQRVVPMLSYRDAPAAITFLCEAFGFEEKMRLEMPNGSIGHAELAYGDSVLNLATCWDEAGLISPSEMEHVHGQTMVYVDDIHAHYERAKAAGATIAAEPEDQFYGAITYRVIDPEGHRWIFQQPTKDVSAEELQAMVDA